MFVQEGNFAIGRSQGHRLNSVQQGGAEVVKFPTEGSRVLISSDLVSKRRSAGLSLMFMGL